MSVTASTDTTVTDSSMTSTDEGSTPYAGSLVLPAATIDSLSVDMVPSRMLVRAIAVMWDEGSNMIFEPKFIGVHDHSLSEAGQADGTMYLLLNKYYQLCSAANVTPGNLPQQVPPPDYEQPPTISGP
jgi:hypothetical protein